MMTRQEFFFRKTGRSLSYKFSESIGKVIAVGPVDKFDFYRQIERDGFKLVGEIRITDQTDGVFLRGNDYASLAFHRLVALFEKLDILAGIVVMVGKNVDLYSRQKALEITYERSRVPDAGNCQNSVVLAHPVEERHRAHCVGKERNKILIDVAREEKLLVGK